MDVDTGVTWEYTSGRVRSDFHSAELDFLVYEQELPGHSLTGFRIKHSRNLC